MPVDKKKFYLSKTFIFNVLFPVIFYFVPAFQLWSQQNMGTLLSIWSAINVVLRFITKDKIGLLD